MDLKRMMIIIAQFCLVLLVFYLAGLALTLPKVVENLANKEVNAREVPPNKMALLYAEINENTKDTMNISKHRAAYQDALAEILENVNLTILQTLSGNAGTVPEDEHLGKIQKLQQYKNSVGELGEFLDSVKA
tara:strand:+ start:5536 stop:5934 length:399 start_codon:yes stop_codon:yes gene_type:complete